MKKFIKVFMWGVGLLLTLAVIAIAAFAFLFDPNAARDDITRMVEAKTGRQMAIEGDLSLTFFPWLGFEAGRTTLSNPPGFTAPTMMSFDTASASVKLMPLLSRRIELSQVTLDGVDLLLEIRQDGVSNWSDLLALQEQDTNTDVPERSFATDGIGGIRLTNTNISYIDAQAGDNYSVSKLDLKTGPLVPGSKFSLTASGDIVSVGDEIAGSASIEGDVRIDKNGAVRIDDPRIQMTGSGAGLPGDELTMSLLSPSLQLDGTTLTVETPTVVLDGTGPGDPYATMKAKLDGNSLKFQMGEKEQDPGTLDVDAPVMDFSATASGEDWSSVQGKFTGQSLRMQTDTPEKDQFTLSVAMPVMDFTAAAPSDTWSAMEGKMSGPTLTLQVGLADADPSILNMDAPVLALTVKAPSGTWSSIKGNFTGQSLNFVNFDRIDLPALTWAGAVDGPDLPGGSVAMTASSERMQGSLDNQNMAFDVMRLKMLDLSIFSKKVKASSIIDDPVLEAPIEIAKFSPLKLLAKLGYNEIVTADPAALSSATISGNASYGPESMGIKNMTGTVDQTAVNGSVKVMTSGQLRFNIVADTVNLDRYRSPSTEPQGAAGEAVGIEDIEIPTEDLRLLDLDGTLKVGKMELVGLHSTDVDIAIRAAAGDIRIKPASAKLYGGTYNGDIHLNATGNLPVLSLNERLDNVQFGPFSKDLLNSERLSGKLSGRMTVSGTGATSNAITASSNGDAVFKFSDGAYEGVNIPAKVRRARAVIKGEPAPPAPTENRTRFGDLSGTAQIKNGVMTTNDINVVMPFMKIRGSGNIVLLTQEVDFSFVGDVYDRPELTAGDNELVGFPVPIKMTGTMAAPNVGVDMGGLFAELAKRKLKDKLNLGRLLGGDTPATPPVDPNADPNADPDAAAEKPPELTPQQELEEKLKKKLKGLLGGGDGG